MATEKPRYTDRALNCAHKYLDAKLISKSRQEIQFTELVECFASMLITLSEKLLGAEFASLLPPLEASMALK